MALRGPPRKAARTASSSSPRATAAPTLTLHGGVPYRASVVALWHDDRLTDFTLCAEGVEFKVHRLVLTSSSEYFLKLFASDTHDATHVLERIRPPVLKALLAFIYEGKCEIHEGLLTEVLEASARLMLDALKAACADAIAARLTPSNALDVWRLANTLTLQRSRRPHSAASLSRLRRTLRRRSRCYPRRSLRTSASRGTTRSSRAPPCTSAALAAGCESC